MKHPKKLHPSQQERALRGDSTLPMAIPIVKPKTVFSPEKVCAYMSAVLLDEIVMGEQKPPIQLQPIPKGKK